jgi:hypothetical protein
MTDTLTIWKNCAILHDGYVRGYNRYAYLVHPLNPLFPDFIITFQGDTVYELQKISMKTMSIVI